MRGLSDILWHINSEVHKLSTTGLDKLSEILDSAELELTKDLTRWKALGLGDARFTPQLYRQALVQIRHALAEIKGPLPKEIQGLLDHNGQVASKLATKHLIEEIQKFSHYFEGAIRPIPLNQVKLLAEAKKTLLPRFRTSAARYAGQIGKDIQKQLAIGVVKGETIDQLTNRLAKLGGPRGKVYLRGAPGDINAKAEYISEGLFKRYRYYGERLARTEINNAYNQTAMDGMDELEKEDPGYYKRWDSALDARTCPYCESMDGQVVGLDASFKDGVESPPLHPNCFLPDTRIAGKATKVMRSWYEGQIVEIKTKRGNKLRVTVNHPIATPQGFRAASTLRKGEYVLSQKGDIWDSLNSSKIDENNRPPQIDQVFSAYRMTNPSALIVPSSNDLHGDARFVKGYIEVVRADSKLLHSSNGLGDLFFPQTTMEQFIHSGLSSGEFGSKGIHLPPASGLRGASLISTSSQISAGPSDRLRFGYPARLNSCLQEPFTHDASTDASLVSKLLLAFPGDIAIDQILEIRYFDFSGHVYDLETETGWMIADGIYTSNCMCCVVVWRKEWKEQRYKHDPLGKVHEGVEPKGVAALPHVVTRKFK